ncbi:tetratricopeptide repeat protein, partial [bacterium]|nr:tetratricopeptide repeat protein [bacterium]
MQKICIFLIISTALVFLYEEGLQAEDYSSPANILGFAEHLCEEGDYIRAASEYQRYLFFSDEKEDNIIYRIGLCYKKGGDFNKAYTWFERLIREYPESELLPSAYYESATSLLLMNRYEGSISKVKEGLGKGDEERLRYILGLNYLKQKRWDDSYALFSSIVQDKNLMDSSSRLKGYTQERKNLPHKSPLLAGLLSSLLPGAGKIYCGRSKDGLFSLLIVGTTAWLSL